MKRYINCLARESLTLIQRIQKCIKRIIYEDFETNRGEYFPENYKLFPDKNDQKWVTLPNLLSKLSKKGKLFPDEYPRIM